MSAILGRIRRCARPALGALLGLAALAGPAAAADDSAETRIKIAYLYNFMKFVSWPDGAQGDMRLCVDGAPALAAAARQSLTGRQVRERRVAVEEVRGAVASCHLVYVGPARNSGTYPAGVLTVGEGRGFVRGGGMIGFALVDDRVRFYVNLGALRRAGLAADSQLLSVALEVMQ
ncbi:MAG: YfiR family protein [Gammaproteobacteria bacterium]|nr:YfiR family protein [Gammaproteobacteria bacterium]